MKKYFKFYMMFLALPFTLHAARVGVTDSGTDFNHKWLTGRALINQNEVAGNRVDDDRNGKVDDVVGWNFVEGYGRIFFPEHLSVVDDQLFHYFEVISRMQSETQTPEDDKFWKENVTSLKDDAKKSLLSRLNFYGQYAHSTHVSGIIASLSPNSKIMSNRIFPDSLPDSSQLATIEVSANGKWNILDMVYKLFAVATNGTFEKVATYLNERQIDVANYSIGSAIQLIAKTSLSLRGHKNPTADDIAKETRRIADQFTPIGKKWMSSSPNTLFVVAAGNDGSDNEKVPVFPANVKTDNSITVAASYGNSKLAKFSNYGALTVDIAAPGVAIVSSVPSQSNDKLLPMSGTSMAAPYITGVAAQIKDINPQLNPVQIKQILMGTVDIKDWLKDKVVSSGVVNPTRAYKASELSKSMGLVAAIDEAKSAVADLPTVGTTSRISNFNSEDFEKFNFANQIVF